MPIYRNPKNDGNRLDLLDRAIARSNEDLKQGKLLIAESLLQEMEVMQPDYAQAVLTLSQKTGERSQAISAKNEALDDLKTVVRDYWMTYQRLAARKNHPQDLFLRLGLKANGQRQEPGSRGEWLLAARKLLTGHQVLIDKGYEVVQTPPIHEIQTHYDVLSSELGGLADADISHAGAERDLAEKRERVDNLIARFVASLRVAFYDVDPPTRRRLMRHYGLFFEMNRNAGQAEPDQSDPGPSDLGPVDLDEPDSVQPEPDESPDGGTTDLGEPLSDEPSRDDPDMAVATRLERLDTLMRG